MPAQIHNGIYAQIHNEQIRQHERRPQAPFALQPGAEDPRYPFGSAPFPPPTPLPGFTDRFARSPASLPASIPAFE